MSERGFTKQNVAVACDISLSSLFRNSEYTIIDIDPDAIAQIAQHHNPEMPDEELLVIASSYQALKAAHLEGRFQTRSASAVPFGLYEARNDTKPARIQVGVYDNWLGASKPLLPPDYIQETAVHELKHAADYSIDSVLFADLRYMLINSVKTATKIGFFTGCAVKILEKTNEHKIPMKHNIQAWTVGIFLNWSKQIVSKTIDSYDYNGPYEARAYEAEKEAASLPKVFTIQ